MIKQNKIEIKLKNPLILSFNFFLVSQNHKRKKIPLNCAKTGIFDSPTRSQNILMYVSLCLAQNQANGDNFIFYLCLEKDSAILNFLSRKSLR